jgi:tRNA(Arg) A34 adenosine deaminase TadA
MRGRFSVVNPDFMREALALAREHMLAGEGGPFGAVLVQEGRVIARGWNRVTSTWDPTAHAEVECLRAAGRALQRFSFAGCELYSSCEPCPMCLAACHWARLDRIYYAASRDDAAAAGFDDALLYRELARADGSALLPRVPLLTTEGAEVFQLWRAKADKIAY